MMFPFQLKDLLTNKDHGVKFFFKVRFDSRYTNHRKLEDFLDSLKFYYFYYILLFTTYYFYYILHSYIVKFVSETMHEESFDLSVSYFQCPTAFIRMMQY